jgi:tetratricopeptide (TPR) repeat protein
MGAREVIGRRLDRLSKRSNEALAIASVIGREFSFDVLAEVSGAAVDELAETLDEAASADIVAPRRHPGRFAFTHALIRETLHEELNTARRAQLHRQVGAAIEKIHAGDLEPYLAEIAHHFFEAGRTEDCAGKAGDYAVRAAERASARLAFEEAAGHYERALQAFEIAATLDRQTRCDLLLARGDALRASGDFGAAREIFMRAADLGRELGDWRRTARAALGMGGAYDVDWWLVQGRFGVADAPTAALAEEAIRALPEGEELLRAHLMMRRALALYWSDTSEARRSRAREAIAMARRTGDPATVAAALHGMLFATDATPNARERLDFADEMLERAREARDRDLILQAHRWRLFTFLQLGDVRAAEGAAEAHAQVVRELPNQRFYSGLLSIFRGTFAMLGGRFTEAERHIGHVGACGEQFPSTELRTMADVQRVYLYIQLGRFDELKHVSGGLIERGSTMPIAQAAAAHLAMMYGLEEEARATFERLAANDFVDLPRGDASWLGMLSHLAGLCFAFGDARRAELLYEEYLPWAAMNCVCATTEPVDGPVSLYLGVLATTCGRLDDAARHFEDALKMATAMGARPYVAETQRAYAQLLLRKGDRSRGLPMLEVALATAEELGMRPLAEKCRALLGGTPSRVEAAQGTFRREGDYWTIAYSAPPFRLKDAKGLGYIATLLRSPGREVACLVLAGGAQTGDAGEVLDERARAEYRRRIAELEAVRVADPAAQGEMDALSAQLSSGVGLGGRSRKTASAAERARVNVRNAITSALNAIRMNDEPLWRHLANAIKTGTFCSYAPDRPLGWEL